MRLWLLRAVWFKNKALDIQANPFDMVFGFVVRAETEDAARRLASENSLSESHFQPNLWLNPECATCIELTPDGAEEVILRDSIEE